MEEKATPNVCMIPYFRRRAHFTLLELIPRYVTNISMIGTIAQQESGAIVLFEHRFFGLSNPYPDLSEESLRYLSVQKNIDDMIYFARNVELPMAGGDAVTPDEAPWVLIGASYAGRVRLSLLTPFVPSMFFFRRCRRVDYAPVRVSFPTTFSNNTDR